MTFMFVVLMAVVVFLVIIVGGLVWLAYVSIEEKDKHIAAQLPENLRGKDGGL